MPRFEVIFTQYYSYDIEADMEDDAIEEAEELFVAEMRYPVARTHYDDIEVIEMEEVEVREIDGE